VLRQEELLSGLNPKLNGSYYLGAELDCTTDIVNYNIYTGEQSKLYEGSSEYYFYIKKVEDDGTIEVSKYSVEKDIQDKEVENIIYTAH